MPISRSVRSAHAKGLPVSYRNNVDISLNQPAPVLSRSQTGNGKDQETCNTDADVEGNPNVEAVLDHPAVAEDYKITRAQWGQLLR